MLPTTCPACTTDFLHTHHTSNERVDFCSGCGYEARTAEKAPQRASARPQAPKVKLLPARGKAAERERHGRPDRQHPRRLARRA